MAFRYLGDQQTDGGSDQEEQGKGFWLCSLWQVCGYWMLLDKNIVYNLATVVFSKADLMAHLNEMSTLCLVFIGMSD